jgi:hypothetical protein
VALVLLTVFDQEIEAPGVGIDVDEGAGGVGAASRLSGPGLGPQAMYANTVSRVLVKNAVEQ